MTILVTGGLGFIGSHFVKAWGNVNFPMEEYIEYPNKTEKIIILDNMTYAADPDHIGNWKDKPIEVYVDDVCNRARVTWLLKKYKPHTIFHFAAETHVDNSISGPTKFVNTNICGTQSLLESIMEVNPKICFFHVSTDEVFGSLGEDDPQSTEESPYRPRSPYAASKAASDHLVQSYHHTYGLKTIISNCSNNYGAYQHEEKFIPTIIRNALSGKPVPVYGNGLNIRDWIHVEDHCQAIIDLWYKGTIGERYCIGGGNQIRNSVLAGMILEILDIPGSKIVSVLDRPGHDFRYDVCFDKLTQHTGWKPKKDYGRFLGETVEFYRERFTT